MKPTTDPRPMVLACFSDLNRLAKAAGRTGLTDHLAESRERLEIGLFRLVVMGEIKKGKSSLINALLGEESLLPVDSDVATSTVYKLMYGPERRFKVFFQPDNEGRNPPPLEIRAEDVASYGTEAGNPGNLKQVAFIGVEVPNAFLKKGLVLVDTPGVGGLYKAHRDITWQYAPNADAVVFVLDSVEAVISQDEVLFLRELVEKVTKRIFFVQTKTDAAGEEQWGAWRDRNLAVLTGKLGLPAEKIPYFPVSAKLKGVADRRASPGHLAESGFPALLDFLDHRLLRQKHCSLASDLAGRLLVACGQLRADLAGRQEVLQAGGKGELDKIRKEYEEARRALDDWQRTRCQPEMREFSRKMSELKQKTRYMLQEALDPTGPSVEPLLDQFRTTDFDVQELNEKVYFVQQNCLAMASQATGDIYTRFNHEATRILAGTISSLGSSIPVPDMGLLPQESGAGSGPDLKLREKLGVHLSDFENIRNCLYGGTAGVTLASVGVSVVSLLFPPAGMVSGMAILMGAIIGSQKANEVATVRKREEAVAKLSHLLQDLMRKVQRHALMQFDEMCSQLDRGTEEKIQEAIEGRRHGFELNLKRIEAARHQTLEARKAEASQLVSWAKELERIEGKISPICQPRAERGDGP